MPLLLRYGGNFPVGRDGPQGRPPPSPGEGAAATVEDRRFRLGRNALRAEPVPCTDCQKRLFPFCTGIGRKSALIWQENMI